MQCIEFILYNADEGNRTSYAIIYPLDESNNKRRKLNASDPFNRAVDGYISTLYQLADTLSIDFNTHTSSKILNTVVSMSGIVRLCTPHSSQRVASILQGKIKGWLDLFLSQGFEEKVF